MSEMIERVAKAIYDATPRDKPYSLLTKFKRDANETEARAAIEAMREPTGEMMDIGVKAVMLAKNASHGPDPSVVMRGGVVLAWGLMIDKAISEKS